MNYKKWKTIIKEQEKKPKPKQKDIKLNEKVTITISKCNDDNIVKIQHGKFYVLL